MDIAKITISDINKDLYNRIREGWDSVAKPLNGLGKLEEITAKIGSINGTVYPDISKRALVIMCADNGIVKEGISQSGQEVTRSVAEWMGRRKSSVCIMAEKAGVDIIPVDIGINTENTPEGVLDRKIRRGTGSFVEESAMTSEELDRAIETGMEIVRECKEQGYKILATGEMGIGNTTTSAAVCAALLNVPVEEVTGRGAGLCDEGYVHKVSVIKQGISKHGLCALQTDKESRQSEMSVKHILSSVGGLDIAGLAGVFTGGAVYGVPVITDGFISAVAALCAERMLPGASRFMICSHIGREPGMKYVLDELGLDPVICADLALGEGTGAVMLFPLIDMALSLYMKGLRFRDTEIEQYKHFI